MIENLAGTPSQLLFGAAYYTEYQLSDRLEADLDLMKDAGFTVIRVGESVWSTWEPRDGEFLLDWLQPVLDGAQARGISVILGTPTYAIPPWLQKKHPELAAETETGKPLHWGGRQEVDYSSPVFLRYAERIIRAIIDRYAHHPAVIGFQVDNEPGLRLFHNEGAFGGFLNSLRAKYGSPEALNREWGLTYWSHRITDWDQLWVPDGNTLPQYDLAWRRYQAGLTTRFIAWQTRIVREYCGQGQFITTCIAYQRPAVEDAKVSIALDVTAGNVYYGTQEHLALSRKLESEQQWTTSGVWGLFRQADRIFSSKQERFLVTETNAQSISGSDQNYPPYPGQLAQSAFALIARGAMLIEYWHWHSLHYGTETYWGGVLPHSLRPGRIYREAAQIGAAIKALSGVLDGYQPDADVALLFSHDSQWAMEFFPPLQLADGTADRRSYQHIFDAFYRGVIDAGSQARIIHADQLAGWNPAGLAQEHPILIAAGFYVADDAELHFLRQYANAGGHLVVGIRTGYGDSEARARGQVAPALISTDAGVWYEEFTNLDQPVGVIGCDDFPVSEGAQALSWADGLIAAGAQVLAGYDHIELGRFPAITTRPAGRGRITYVGTLPDTQLAADLIRWLVPRPIGQPWLDAASPEVTVASGIAGGRRICFIHNWASTPGSITVPSAAIDCISGERYDADQRLPLEPWACRVMVDAETAPAHDRHTE